jgi:hypothetical protein
MSKPRTDADRLIEELVPELSTPLTGIGMRTSQQGSVRLDELAPAEREKVRSSVRATMLCTNVAVACHMPLTFHPNARARSCSI